MIVIWIDENAVLLLSFFSFIICSFENRVLSQWLILKFLQTEAWDTWKLAICPWWFTLSHSFSVTPFSIYVPTGKTLSEELTIEEAFTKRNAYSVAKLYAPNKKCSCLDTMLNNLNLFLFPAKTLVRGLFWSPCKGNSNANMRRGLGVHHILSLYWSESVGFGFHPASSNLYF